MTSLSIFTKNSSEKPKDLESKRISFAFEKRFQEQIQKRKITKEYQFFGIWIAQNLGDTKNIPLYIRLAKTQDKILLESAVSYVKDYPNARSRMHLFLWFLKGKLRSSGKFKIQNSKFKIKKKKFENVELIDKNYEQYSVNKEQSVIQEKIENILDESKVEKEIQITNPKEYLFEKLLKTRKFSDSLVKDKYFEVYKVDMFSPNIQIAIDVIDERDESLAKKTYFDKKRRYFQLKKINYHQISAVQVTANYSKVLIDLINS